VAPLSVDHVPATAFAMGGLLGEQEWWQQVHGEHRPQVSQAFILGNAFANPAQLNDPLFELTPLNLPSWLCALGDRRALTLRPDATYLLATDGLWSCSDPYGWVGQWPQLLGGPLAMRPACCERLLQTPTRPSAARSSIRQRERDPAALPPGAGRHREDETVLPGA
jgi:hypothetical protein